MVLFKMLSILLVGSFSMVVSQKLQSKFCCAPSKFESSLNFMGATAQGATPAPVLVSIAHMYIALLFTD